MTRIKSQLGILGLAVVALSLGSSPTRAQPGKSPKDARGGGDQTAGLHELYMQDALEYRFSLDREGQRKLELRREPVMRYTSEFDRSQGEVYIWTREGRAEVVGCIFSQPVDKARRRVIHEFHSLALAPLFASTPGGSGWQAQESGIVLQSIPDAPKPAASRTQRLIQMRDLARGFSAHMARQDAQRDELRLLPQPLYRYQPAGDDSPVVDGAVFAYVWTVSTDPEVLLVMEARRTGGEARWEFALARFTNRGAWVNFQNREVWRVAPTRSGSPGMASQRYGLFVVKTVSNAIDTP